MSKDVTELIQMQYAEVAVSGEGKSWASVWPGLLLRRSPAISWRFDRVWKNFFLLRRSSSSSCNLDGSFINFIRHSICEGREMSAGREENSIFLYPNKPRGTITNSTSAQTEEKKSPQKCPQTHFGVSSIVKNTRAGVSQKVLLRKVSEKSQQSRDKSCDEASGQKISTDGVAFAADNIQQNASDVRKFRFPFTDNQVARKSSKRNEGMK